MQHENRQQPWHKPFSLYLYFTLPFRFSKLQRILQTKKGSRIRNLLAGLFFGVGVLEILSAEDIAWLAKYWGNMVAWFGQRIATVFESGGLIITPLESYWLAISYSIVAINFLQVMKLSISNKRSLLAGFKNPYKYLNKRKKIAYLLKIRELDLVVMLAFGSAVNCFILFYYLLPIEQPDVHTVNGFLVMSSCLFAMACTIVIDWHLPSKIAVIMFAVLLFSPIHAMYKSSKKMLLEDIAKIENTHTIGGYSAPTLNNINSNK